MTVSGSAPVVTKDGFRLRGLDVTRLEAFTDAAFAFAVTLLVISVEAVPTGFADLTAALRTVPAFALGFAMLLVFWHGHWEWSRRYGLEDGPSMLLSFALIFVALVYVYPLKYMSLLITWWITGGRLGSVAELRGLDELYGVFMLYGIGFAAMAGLVALLNLHALRLREPLDLNPREIALTRTNVAVWLTLAAVGALSALIAAFTEPSAFGAPGWVYMILPIAVPLAARRVLRAESGASQRLR